MLSTKYFRVPLDKTFNIIKPSFTVLQLKHNWFRVSSTPCLGLSWTRNQLYGCKYAIMSGSHDCDPRLPVFRFYSWRVSLQGHQPAGVWPVQSSLHHHVPYHIWRPLAGKQWTHLMWNQATIEIFQSLSMTAFSKPEAMANSNCRHSVPKVVSSSAIPLPNWAF